jgi:hypothetical protein
MIIYHAIIYIQKQNLVSTLIKLQEIYKLVPLRLKTQGDTTLYFRECCIQQLQKYIGPAQEGTETLLLIAQISHR